MSVDYCLRCEFISQCSPCARVVVASSRQRKNASRPAPGNKLSEEERQTVIVVCNSDRFQRLPPSQIVRILADEGEYLGSERTIYRVLHERGLKYQHGCTDDISHRRPTSYCATGSNQIWCWDITFLRSPVRGQFYYLYCWCSTGSKSKART